MRSATSRRSLSFAASANSAHNASQFTSVIAQSTISSAQSSWYSINYVNWPQVGLADRFSGRLWVFYFLLAGGCPRSGARASRQYEDRVSPARFKHFRQPSGQFGDGAGPESHRQFGCPRGRLPDSPIGPNRTRSHDKAALAPDVYSFRKIALPIAESPADRLPVKVMLPAPGGAGLGMMGAFLVFDP